MNAPAREAARHLAGKLPSRADPVVLVQVKTRDWPGELERRALAEFPAPPNARKLLHRWRPRQRQPDVQEV